jgi:acetyl esterase/lipase
LVTNGFDPLRDVGHAYAQKLAAAGNDLTYIHNPDLTHGFPQFTRSSAACHQATLELADLIKTKIGRRHGDLAQGGLPTVWSSRAASQPNLGRRVPRPEAHDLPEVTDGMGRARPPGRRTRVPGSQAG